MKTALTIELDDERRRALAAHYGDGGFATRERIRQWVESLVSATIDEIMSEYEQDKRP